MAKVVLWRPDEDAILIALYESARQDVIMEKLPGRTWESIKCRAAARKLRRPKECHGDTWTEREDDLLRAKYSTVRRISDLETDLPGRSYWSIMHRAKRLKLKRDVSARVDCWRESIRVGVSAGRPVSKANAVQAEAMWAAAFAKYNRVPA